MIDTIDVPHDTPIIIESDNCSAQYKSTQHFFHLQSLADEQSKIVIRLYGIAGHGKGEVDHVGGVAKVAVRKEIAGKNILYFYHP